MISRSFLAIVVAAGTAGAAVADVKVNTPGAQIRTPGGGVDLDVDVGSKMTPTDAAKILPSDAWLGRGVYSIDGKHLGEVAAVTNGNMYVDIGGFLGIGESRVLLTASEIGSVTEERIVLKLTEQEAKNLPSTDSRANPPK